VRFAFIRDHTALFEVAIMLRVLGVSKSGFYAWLKRLTSPRATLNAVLLEEIKVVHNASRGSYGSPRVTAALRRSGSRVSKHRVARLMRTADLRGKSHHNSRVSTTNSKHSQPRNANLLERDFKAGEPNQKWLSDITYLSTTEGWLYLAIVLDVFSRRIVGWAFSSSLESNLVVSAFDMACQSRKPSEGLVFHSDQGVQYASLEFRQTLARLEVVQSMSRKGDCWDNSPCESFFSTLKLELDLRKSRGTKLETQAIVFEWMEVFYNRQRLHSSLNFLSPAEFENSRAA
jgi:putative transposase